MNLFGSNRFTKSAETPHSTFPAAGRPVNPPVIVAPDPARREMEVALALLVYRVTETLAKTELYFPASDLRLLGLPDDTDALCKRTNRMACALMLRTDIKHGERFVVYAGEIGDALRTAERVADSVRLLCADKHSASALPLITRVSEASEQVIKLSAKVLEVEASDVFRRANALVAARNDTETATHKAVTLLSRRPALLPAPTERLARTTIWALEIVSETVARVALQCRGAMLPTPLVPEPPRSVRPIYAAPRSAFAPV